MNRYHINPHTGVPNICRAKKGNCPYEGAFGNSNHYDSYSEAQEASFEIMRDEFGIVYDLAADEERKGRHSQLEDYEEYERVIGSEMVYDDREYDEIIRDIVNTEDEEKITNILDGLYYANKDWNKVSAVLQNPNIPEAFLEDIVDRPNNYHLETVRMIMRNRRLNQVQLFEFSSRQNNDIYARGIAMSNKSIKVETVDKLAKSKPELMTKAPWAVLLEEERFQELDSIKGIKASSAYKDNQKNINMYLSKLNQYPDWWDEYGDNK